MCNSSDSEVESLSIKSSTRSRKPKSSISKYKANKSTSLKPSTNNSSKVLDARLDLSEHSSSVLQETTNGDLVPSDASPSIGRGLCQKYKTNPIKEDQIKATALIKCEDGNSTNRVTSTEISKIHSGREEFNESDTSNDEEVTDDSDDENEDTGASDDSEVSSASVAAPIDAIQTSADRINVMMREHLLRKTHALGFQNLKNNVNINISFSIVIAFSG